MHLIKQSGLLKDDFLRSRRDAGMDHLLNYLEVIPHGLPSCYLSTKHRMGRHLRWNFRINLNLLVLSCFVRYFCSCVDVG